MKVLKGHESPGEDSGRPHQTVGVIRWFPVWLHPRQRHNRRNICCQAAAREVSSRQQETLLGFCRPGEGFWSSTLEGHLVGDEKLGSVALEWAATASSAMAANIGCTRNAVGSRAWLRTLATDGGQTTEGSPRWTWQAGGGSFLLLPRRHALSSRWLWSFNHNTCENRLEEVQGAATSSLFMTPLFQDRWPCVQFLCAERNAPCQWDLAIDKTKPPTSATEWQGNDQTDLQCQAARRYHQVHWATCVAYWESGPHSEGEKAPLVWTCGMLQWCSQDSLSHTCWGKALDLERSNGKERTESKCRKDDHDLRYGLDLLQSSEEFPCAVCHTGRLKMT